MSAAFSSLPVATRHFTPEQIDCAIRGVVRRSITDDDEAALVMKRMRRVMSGEATVDEVSRGGSVIPKHLLEAYVKAARIALEHIVDCIAEAIAAFQQASIGQKSNDATEPDVQSTTADNAHKSTVTPPSSKTQASSSKPSETPAVQPTPRSACVKNTPRPWGPLSKRKPTLDAEVLGSSIASATENQADTVYLDGFAAPDCFVDIDAETQARMEEILAKMCDECGKVIRDLKRHKEEVHAVQGQKRFACEECSAAYVHERALHRHMKDKHRRKSKGVLVVPTEHDGESDEITISAIITDDLAEKIGSLVGSIGADEAMLDGQEGPIPVEEAPTDFATSVEEPIDVGDADDIYQNLAFDLEMAKMDNSIMEFDLHLSDASDPVVDENMENIPITELFPSGHLVVGKDIAAGQDYDAFVDIENIGGEDA